MAEPGTTWQAQAEIRKRPPPAVKQCDKQKKMGGAGSGNRSYPVSGELSERREGELIFVF